MALGLATIHIGLEVIIEFDYSGPTGKLITEIVGVSFSLWRYLRI